MRGGGQSIICFKLDHWPGRDAHCDECFLKRNELPIQSRLDADSCFVTRPKVISKRFDDVIRRDTDMGCPVLNHLRDHSQQPTNRAKRRISFTKASNAVEMTKEFVSTVNQVNDHRDGFGVPITRAVKIKT